MKNKPKRVVYNRLMVEFMKQFVIILIFLLFSVKGFSTQQVEDYLIFNKDTLYFYEFPDYINSPLEQIIITLGHIINPNVISSGCWRGYYAEWKIIDSTLYLSKVFDCFTREVVKNNIVEKAIGRKFTNGLLKADWVNGNFSCGKVRILSLYISTYRHNFKFLIVNGKIIKEEYYTSCMI